MPRSGDPSLQDVSRRLESIREGLARARPDRDWEPIVLAGKLGTLSELFRGFYQCAYQDLELSTVEIQTLGLLRSGTCDTPSALANAAHQTAAGMTRTLDRLETRGLISRKSHPSDRRAVVVGFTRHGREMADCALDIELEALSFLLGGPVDGVRQKRFLKALDVVVEQLAQGTTRLVEERTASVAVRD